MPREEITDKAIVEAILSSLDQGYTVRQIRRLVEQAIEQYQLETGDLEPDEH